MTRQFPDRGNMPVSETRLLDDTTEKIDHAYIVERTKLGAAFIMTQCDPGNPEDVMRLYTALDSLEVLLSYKTDNSPTFLGFNQKFKRWIPDIDMAVKYCYSNDRRRYFLYRMLKQKFEHLIQLQRDTLSFGYEGVADYVFPERQYESYLVNAIKKTIEVEQKNVIILVVGDPGTGKSLISMGITRCFDITFDDTRVAHKTADNFINVVNNIMEKYGDGGGGRGKAIVWDDAGKGLKTEERWDYMFKAVQDILQTFRIEGYLVVINCPDEGIISSKMENYINYIIYTKDLIDRRSELAWAKVYEYKKNRNTQKIYKKFIIAEENRFYKARPKKVDMIAVKKISADLEKRYVDEKVRTNKIIVKDAKFVIDAINASVAKENINLAEILREARADMEDFISTYHKRVYIDVNKIRSHFVDRDGRPLLSENHAKLVRSELEKDRKRAHMSVPTIS